MSQKEPALSRPISPRDDVQARITDCAYRKGYDLDDWLEAEREMFSPESNASSCKGCVDGPVDYDKGRENVPVKASLKEAEASQAHAKRLTSRRERSNLMVLTGRSKESV